MTAKRNTQSKKSNLDVRRIAISVTALLMALLMLLPLVADVVLYGHAITQADIDATQASINSTKSDIDALNQQKAALASQQVEAQKTLDDLAKQENSAIERLNALEEKIGILADQINTTQEIIDEYDVMIQETQVKLADAQVQEETYYNLFLERVRSMEEEGTVSYWEILFQAASFSDLLDRLSFVNDVMKYDNDMMDNLEAARQAVSAAEAELESEQAEQEEAKAQLESEMAEQEEAAIQEEQVLNEILANEELYAAQIEQLSTQQEALVGEISAAEQELARQEAQKALLEQQKREEEEAERRRLEEERRRQEEEERKRQEEEERRRQEEQNQQNQQEPETPSTPDTPDSSTDAPSSSGGKNPTGSVSGSAIISYASQFVGNPYVWGGNSLTDGIDCSGFVHEVLAHFGISSPRYSASFRSFGKAVSEENMQVGDILCYSGHVGFYAGGGQLLSALGKDYGITYCSAYYKPILAVRRA
ncbi:MAG: NlpC/P60 family protein [Candidatus Onthomonas sp.]